MFKQLSNSPRVQNTTITMIIYPKIFLNFLLENLSNTLKKKNNSIPYISDECPEHILWVNYKPKRQLWNSACVLDIKLMLCM